MKALVLSFVDIRLIRHADGTVGGSVFLNATHINLYLQNRSFHHPAQKLSALATLVDRPRKIADGDHLKEELKVSERRFQTTWLYSE